MHRALVLLLAGLAAETISTGPQVLTFLSDVDDSDQPYALYLPRDYNPSRQWPLVISLHDAGSSHRLNLRRVLGQGNRVGESDAQAARTFPGAGDVEFIVASPLARGTMGYQGIPEKDVLEVLADVRRRFSVDDDRVYLTGISMGGGGALWLSLTRPDIWAAVAAVCPAPPPGIENLAGNALNIPVKLFQGEIDPLVPAVQTRGWHQKLIEAGVRAEYVEYKGVRHNAWDYAYKDKGVFSWFNQFRRVRRPAKIHFSTESYARNSAYWLRLEKLTPGVPGTIDGEFLRGRLVLRTKNIDAISVDITRTPERPSAVEIDGSVIRLRPGRPLSFVKGAKGWSVGQVKRVPNDKQPGAEGPISDAISSRHVYVYGTSGPASPEDLIRRRDIATRAAQWSSPRSPLQLSFRVVSDKEAKDSDVAGTNLVLFGTKETNARINEIAAKLPLHLNPGAADYGLVYVYPVDGRYVVISSGLPWWTRLDQTQRPGLSFVSPAWRTLQSFGDFIVFRGGLDHVVAEGRFDDHWRFPPALAETLRGTGALEITQK